MSIYSNDNIRKIAKLTTRELPQKSKNAKITVRENNGLYSRVVPTHYTQGKNTREERMICFQIQQNRYHGIPKNYI